MAWAPLGWQAIAFAEVPNRGDLTAYKEWPDGAAVDVLVGGTPCQSFSVAGLRGGMADPRGNLALTFLGLVDHARPRWVVWENVPGVLSADDGRAFGSFLGGLVELGYGFAYRVLDAQFFGLAQRRKRVFVVARAGDWRGPAAVLLERAGLRGDPAPRRQSGQGAAASLTRGADSSGRGIYAGRRREDDINLVAHTPDVARPLAGGSPSSGGYRNDADTADNLVAGTLRGGGATAGAHRKRSGDDAPELLVTHTLRGDGHDAGEDGSGRGTPIIPFDTTQITHPENRCQPTVGAPCHPVAAHGHSPAIAFQGRQDPQVSGDVTHPISASDKGPGVAVDIDNVLLGGDVSGTLGAEAQRRVNRGQGVLQGGVRRLTPRECERLQGFADDWTLVPYRGKPAKDGPRYKALGNSFPVPVVRWIGERIALVDALCVDP